MPKSARVRRVVFAYLSSTPRTTGRLLKEASMTWTWLTPQRKAAALAALAAIIVTITTCARTWLRPDVATASPHPAATSSPTSSPP